MLYVLVPVPVRMPHLASSGHGSRSREPGALTRQTVVLKATWSSHSGSDHTISFSYLLFKFLKTTWKHLETTAPDFGNEKKECPRTSVCFLFWQLFASIPLINSPRLQLNASPAEEWIWALQLRCPMKSSFVDVPRGQENNPSPWTWACICVNICMFTSFMCTYIYIL